MTRRALRWGWLLVLIFALATTLVAYFAWQLGRHHPPEPANFLAADKSYGVTIDLTRHEDDALSETLASMRRSGLVWLRQPVSWADIEPVPGQFDWQALDRIVAAVADANRTVPGDRQANPFKLIAVLQDAPAWTRAEDASPSAPPIDLSDFGRFASAFAARYGDQLDYYQIWHQPNLSANWGDTFVDAAAYADLLREAALNIRAADPTAFILTAALAATLEDGPLNLDELTYLDQLYQVKADRWFDVVATQPYGLWTKPLDPSAPDQLNFRRTELIRQVMLNHGDHQTPLWATAFGWVALPADWSGQPSPWSSDLPSVQAPRTAAAIEYARRHWPWLGPMLAARWDAVDLTADDPARGLALIETPPILAVIKTAAGQDAVATPGRYPATHPSGHYSTGWRFALSQADIPQNEPQTLTIPFEGTRLGLTVNRGDFRGTLWVTVDGHPANALPQDDRGRSYVILSDPLYETETVTLARHLPVGRHEAIIEADGGWEQWAIGGWTVYNEADTQALETGLTAAGVAAILSGLGVLYLLGLAVARGVDPDSSSSSTPESDETIRPRSSALKPVWAWSEIFVALYNSFGERTHLILTFGLAAFIYWRQGSVALTLLPLLALLILFRPDLGLALVTFAIFVFEIPLRLPIGSFSPVELTLPLTVIGFVFRELLRVGRTVYADPASSASPEIEDFFSPVSAPGSSAGPSRLPIPPLKSTDWAAIALVGLALLATLAAENFAVSFREWRVVVFESVVFYFLVRLGRDYGYSLRKKVSSDRWAWRLVDLFVAGAALQAAAALYFYVFTDQTIDAEGVRRALGLAGGSPNNLALILDRAWPILLAVTVLAKRSYRRWFYGSALIAVSLALYLTFSKGALLLGLPLSLAAMTLLYGWRRWRQSGRRMVAAVAAVLIGFAVILIPFSQTRRFQTTFDFDEGSTGFFRLKLWQSSWAMLQDHWLLGVGLDNFLYQYRTRYILPEAWQEPDLNHPHNLILDFGTRLGLGGIVVLLWLQVAFWRNAWQLYKHRFDALTLGMIGSMVVFLGHGLVDNSYFLVDLAFAFFLIAGLVQRLVEQVSEPTLKKSTA